MAVVPSGAREEAGERDKCRGKIGEADAAISSATPLKERHHIL